MSNEYPDLTQSMLDAIAMAMEDEIREELAPSREWGHPGEFLTAYMARDRTFPIHQFATR